MNRMLFLRDLDVDVLIRCRACGHEGVLPHAEALRRFGPAYPVLSIAPHYRCSSCNARAAESLAAPAPEPDYATLVDNHLGHDEDDGGFAAALASLQSLVEAAHSPPAAARRKAKTPVEPEPPPPPVENAWDAEEEAAARAAWDAEPVWTPPFAAAGADDEDDEDEPPPPRRQRDTPPLPDRPFFASRERRKPDSEPESRESAAPSGVVPLSAMPVLSLADIQALLGGDDDQNSQSDENETPPPEQAVAEDGGFDVTDPEQQASADDAALDDEDDPLLSSALQRLLRNASTVDSDDGEDDADANESAVEEEGEALFPPFEPDSEVVLVDDEPAEEELSDDDLISFAIGDRDAAGAGDAVVSDALPPEMAALLADDDDEDEVYEYAADEIIDAPPADAPPAAAPPKDPVDVDIAEIVDFANVADDEDVSSAVAADVEDEPLLLEEAVPALRPASSDAGELDEDPDLAALRALLAETESGDDVDLDDDALRDMGGDGGARQGGGFERPPRDPLIDDGDDGAIDAPPLAWRTQRPPPGADGEGEEGMEDALAALRAMIEQAAAEPESEEGAAAPEPSLPPSEDDEVDFETPPPAFVARIDDEDDDPEAWAALMREVAAKAAGDDENTVSPSQQSDDTLPLAASNSPPPTTTAAAAAAAPVAQAPAAGKRGAGLDDTLSRLRGLLDLPEDPPPRGRGRRKG